MIRCGDTDGADIRLEASDDGPSFRPRSSLIQASSSGWMWPWETALLGSLTPWSSRHRLSLDRSDPGQFDGMSFDFADMCMSEKILRGGFAACCVRRHWPDVHGPHPLAMYIFTPPLPRSSVFGLVCCTSSTLLPVSSVLEHREAHKPNRTGNPNTSGLPATGQHETSLSSDDFCRSRRGDPALPRVLRLETHGARAW